MKHLFLCLCCLTTLLAACTTKYDKDKEVDAIEQLKGNLSPLSIIADDSTVGALLSRYQDFTAHFPDDSLAPVYLLESAELNIAIGQQEDAIAILDTLIATYPGFEDIGSGYFLKGWALENAERYDSAIATYRFFLENYPNHVQAPGVRTMLKNNLVGASQEQLMDYVIAHANSNNIEQ